MGSGSSGAQQQAQQAEAQRQAQIDATTGAINSAYDSPQRAQQIQDFVQALRSYYGQDLDRQKAINDRELRFALARNGVIGGSTQLDQQRNAGEMFQRGVLDAEQRAQSAGAQLHGQDAQTRLNLLSMAQTGLDAGTAAQQAASAMQTSLQSGMGDAQAQGLGDIFGTMAKFYDKSNQTKQYRQEFGTPIYQSLYGFAPAQKSTPFYTWGQ